MLKKLKPVVLGCLALVLATPSFAQVKQTREQMMFYTGEWKGDRFPDGRPKVSDDLLKRVLESDGYEVEMATDSAGALRAVADGAPDLVLLDVVLGGEDGRDLLVQHCLGRLRTAE